MACPGTEPRRRPILLSVAYRCARPNLLSYSVCLLATLLATLMMQVVPAVHSSAFAQLNVFSLSLIGTARGVPKHRVAVATAASSSPLGMARMCLRSRALGCKAGVSLSDARVWHLLGRFMAVCRFLTQAHAFDEKHGKTFV